MIIVFAECVCVYFSLIKIFKWKNSENTWSFDIFHLKKKRINSKKYGNIERREQIYKCQHTNRKVQMNFSVWLCLPDRHFHGCFRRLFQDVRLCPVIRRLLGPTGFHPWSSSNRRYINVNTRPYNNYYSSITGLIGNIIFRMIRSDGQEIFFRYLSACRFPL